MATHPARHKPGRSVEVGNLPAKALTCVRAPDHCCLPAKSRESGDLFFISGDVGQVGGDAAVLTDNPLGKKDAA
jgi:hypothetical protein